MRKSGSLHLARPYRRRMAAASVVSLAGLCALAVWLGVFERNTPSASRRASPAVEKTNPADSFATVREVIATGGGSLAREAAIAWLDRQARERAALSTGAESTLLDMLRDGGHAGWPPGYRQHFFNSACNALRVRPSGGGETLARILQSHATSQPDRILRLYALQHLDSMRKSGHLAGAPGGEIHAMLQSLATAPESDVAGTALKILGEWDGPSSEASPDSIELAARIAADRSRPVDVRVCAIHTAGATSLEPARAIAADTSEPVLLRKAAIARIGRHGDLSDLPDLLSLRGESSRLAQAVDPALQALRKRLDSPGPSSPQPYPQSHPISSP